MMDEHSAHPPIEDYAVIGDCRSAALISRSGSIDWLCLPRIDSPAIFSAILDMQRGGRFQIRPTVPFSTSRRYIGESNVLETTFTTETGVLQLVDAMPVASEEEKRRQLWPDHQILRSIECLEGEVEIEISFDPRPDYARTVPKLVNRHQLGIICEHRGYMLNLRSEIPLTIATDQSRAGVRATLRSSERRYLSLSFNLEEPAIIPPLGEEARAKIDRSLRWWQNWISQARYDGPYRDAVIRSLLTLKLMTYAPSGAVVAAPSTSLPEQIGGVRNWDYRYCWLRDASLTLRALYDAGLYQEGEAFTSWLLHATRLTWPELQVLYDVFGETRLPEHEFDHLDGYRNSRPVRIGNDAENQLQLDIYGEVIDAAFRFTRYGGRLDRNTARMLVGLGKAVCRRWREPDEGIWEVRSGRRHHTYSKVMCWIGLDRLLRLHNERHVNVPVEQFTREREEIRDAVETYGYNEHLQSYVSEFNGDRLDASLLLLDLYGYTDPGSPRMRSTYDRIREHLGRNGLLYRYLDSEDGLPPGEGAFGICSFWAVECQARQGDLDGAAASFEDLLSFGNDVGLFAEEIDPGTGMALGNFPQAFTHIGLLNAAQTLSGATGRDTESGTRSTGVEAQP